MNMNLNEEILNTHRVSDDKLYFTRCQFKRQSDLLNQQSITQIDSLMLNNKDDVPNHPVTHVSIGRPKARSKIHTTTAFKANLFDSMNASQLDETIKKSNLNVNRPSINNDIAALNPKNNINREKEVKKKGFLCGIFSCF
jgi:hypothetical protein